MKAQCPCVASQARTPIPECDKCGGTGVWEVLFPDIDEIEALWIGRCPVCGCENGGFIQQKGKLNPLEDKCEQEWLPVCLNDKCPNKYVQWIKAGEIMATWEAICPICNTGHWCNYLQLANHLLATPEEMILECSNESCQYAAMSWLRADYY